MEEWLMGPPFLIGDRVAHIPRYSRSLLFLIGDRVAHIPRYSRSLLLLIGDRVAHIPRYSRRQGRTVTEVGTAVTE